MKLAPPSLLLVPLFLACATVNNDLPLDEGAGGAGSGGTSGGNTGGTIGAGNSTSTTGGSSSGGAATGGTGGAATGGAGTGGASSGGTGGTATGGAGTGGALMITEGDCAGLPTLATWPAPRATGDQVVLQCSIAQASCAGLPTNTNILWECVATHVPNCEGQSPSGGTGVWQYVRTCTTEESTEEPSP